ncbi:MAG: hypothetical protein ACOYVF_02385, partial [Candidatus Zixiibacteriota bacterium]
MGPLFVIILWIIISIPFGLAAGFLFSYVGIPLYYRIRKIPKEKRHFKGVYMLIPTAIVGFLFVCLVSILVVTVFVLETIDSNDYWKSQGFADS